MGMLEVDPKGLGALQKEKPITFIINELCQNAFDEDISMCKLDIKYDDRKKEIWLNIEDDDPDGFEDIRDAYTLFKHTDKRLNPTQRGRFNMGEKQVIVCSKKVTVRTTKGTVVFDVPSDKRRNFKESRDKGSDVTVVLKSSRKDYETMVEHAKSLLVPKEIVYVVNGEKILPKKPFKVFEVILNTEILKNEVMTRTSRKTTVELTETGGQPYIYEMGIPVMKTDCPWNINVQQKIPLAIDRETIKDGYVKDLYAEVLNHAYGDIEEESISSVWIRTGMKDDRVNKEAVETVIHKRYGDKVLVKNPFDSHANEEAITHGYTLIQGQQMSTEEWDNVKKHKVIETTTQKFGTDDFSVAQTVEPNDAQSRYAEFLKKVAKEYLGVDLTVKFIKAGLMSPAADYGGRTVRFNISKLGNGFFDKINWQNLSLSIHELSHECGGHIEHGYHSAMTKLGAQLIIKALEEPEFFRVN